MPYSLKPLPCLHLMLIATIAAVGFIAAGPAAADPQELKMIEHGFWTLTLDKGQITVEGPFNDTGDSLFAITGGTGDFAGAEGEMALSAYGTKGDAYTFIYKVK